MTGKRIPKPRKGRKLVKRRVVRRERLASKHASVVGREQPQCR